MYLMIGSSYGDNSVSDRVVAQFLTELDGVESRVGVYVIGATNRLELIDNAILRAKRFSTLLYVPLPVASERRLILEALIRTKKGSYAQDLDLNAIASDIRCEGKLNCENDELMIVFICNIQDFLVRICQI